jgi:hypothetical protein
MRWRLAEVVVVAAIGWPLFGNAAPHASDSASPVRVELPGKPTGPIAVEHRLAGEPMVGVPLKIALTARVAGTVGRLSIEATATTPRAALVSAPLLVAVEGDAYAWELTVVPLAADAGYLSVIVSGTIDGVEQARSVTIALRSTVLAEALDVTIADGEALIELPVQESP